jgi:hypothetical protein
LQRVEPGYRGDHVLSAQAYAALLRRQEPDRVAHCRRHPAARRRARVGHHRRRRTSVRPEPGVQVYQPLSQSAGLAGRFLIRTQSDPLLAAKVLREDVHAIDPDMPVVNVRTLDDLRERYLATPKLTAMLLTIFAGLALLVTMAGLTGVIAASVTQRTQEFGVRMALGASRNRVMTGVIGQGLGLVAIGLALGIAASTALTRVLSAYLFDTQPTDPITFAAVGAAFVIAGVVACAGPAWRATTVDPIVALRTE